MQLYLPIAEMAVHVETIAFLGGIVGIISGVFGVGGGFLTTPFLIFLGIPPAIAVGTQASQLVASSTTAVIGHWKKDHIDFKMAGILLIGGLAGTLIGVFLFKLLQHLGQIDLVIAVLYVLFLCGIGGMMLQESVMTLWHLRNPSTPSDSRPETSPQQSRFRKWQENLPYKMPFPHSRLFISALIPLFIGFLGGLMVSIMGIGAGFLLVPAMIYLLRMPPLLVTGTSLAQIMVTSAIACILHSIANNALDLLLAVILIGGSVIGAQIGVRLSRYIKGAVARFTLAMIIVLVGIKLGSDLFIPPAYLYSITVGG